MSQSVVSIVTLLSYRAGCALRLPIGWSESPSVYTIQCDLKFPLWTVVQRWEIQNSVSKIPVFSPFAGGLHTYLCVCGVCVCGVCVCGVCVCGVCVCVVCGLAGVCVSEASQVFVWNVPRVDCLDQQSREYYDSSYCPTEN